MRALAAVSLVALGGCGAGESYGSLPPPAHSSSAACAAAGCGEAEVVVAQYRRFWAESLPAASGAAPGLRRAVLAPVTAEPELTHLVRSLAVLDGKGQRSYGTDAPVSQTVRVNGLAAQVDGCLDSSRSGVADAITGKPITRGVARNPVSVEMVRGPDEIWRVAAVTYPGDTTC
ncbi:hypothetical protein GCM10009539_67860 [Cryptosporangium japonicum]|uniref:Lipoprotein n=1 Tax=Cryptosporangium japonicum TaxID=80872 RepID=A0ABP3ERH2_9ACTN